MNELLIALSLICSCASAVEMPREQSTILTPQQKFIVTSDGQRRPFNGKQLEQLHFKFFGNLVLNNDAFNAYLKDCVTKNRPYPETTDTVPVSADLQERYEHLQKDITRIEQANRVWHELAQAFDATNWKVSDFTFDIDSTIYDALAESIIHPDQIDKITAHFSADALSKFEYAAHFLGCDSHKAIASFICTHISELNKKSFITSLSHIVALSKEHRQLQSAVTINLIANGLQPQIDTLPFKNVREFKPSPNGRQLAFTIEYQYSDQLYLYDITQPETAPFHIMDHVCSNFQFSSNGKYLVLEAGDNQLYLCDTTTPEIAPICIGDYVYDFLLSQDRTKIAFTKDRQQRDHFYLYDTTKPDAAPNRITIDTWFAQNLPNETKLALKVDEYTQQAYLYDKTKPEAIPTHIMNNVGFFRLSPNNRQLALTKGNAHAQQLYLYDTTTPNIAPVHIMDMDNVWELQFSPDGRRLAFTTHGAHAQQLYLYDTTTPEAAPTNIMNDVGRFEFSPDSTKLAFKSHYSYSQLYFYEITTPEIKPISIMKDVRNFHFLLDGRLIVCSEGNRDLRIINLTDGLELIQQIFMLCVLSNERAGHPVTFTRTEINEIDKQQQDFSASHRPLLDLPPDLLEHVHIVG